MSLLHFVTHCLTIVFKMGYTVKRVRGRQQLMVHVQASSRGRHKDENIQFNMDYNIFVYIIKLSVKCIYICTLNVLIKMCCFRRLHAEKNDRRIFFFVFSLLVLAFILSLRLQ